MPEHLSLHNFVAKQIMGEEKHLLTKREIEVLKMVMAETPSAEIAKIFNISVRTVDTHRKNILRKLNVKTLIALTKYAITQGWIEGYRYNYKYKRST